MLGETPLELHRRLRMERAAWRLVHHDNPITEIAFAAGYETHESFTRAFRVHYQCSPTEFRQSPSNRRGGCERPFQIELPARSGIHFSGDSQIVSIAFTEGEPTMKVEIKEMPELRVATVSHVGPYHRISEAFARLGEIAGPKVAAALPKGRRPSVIWLQLRECTGRSRAFCDRRIRRSVL